MLPHEQFNSTLNHIRPPLKPLWAQCVRMCKYKNRRKIFNTRKEEQALEERVGKKMKSNL